MSPSRSAYLLIAIAVHAGVLWGVRFAPPAIISAVEQPGEAIEVGLVESAESSAPEPAPPEPPPPTPPVPPPATEQMPTPPPQDAIPDPVPKPPKPSPKPTAIPQPKAAARPIAPASTAPKSSGASTGNPSAASVRKPGRGDAIHATWRNRVRPSYPATARAAGESGRVLVVVNVDALGRATSARISKTSGVASLDQAALAAARASTYHPKRIGGLPLPDTITIPYTFRLEDR